jgi:hypothetical protein
MTDREREALAFRTIVVSGRAARAHANDATDRERINNTVTELLARLEEDVLRERHRSRHGACFVAGYGHAQPRVDGVGVTGPEAPGATSVYGRAIEAIRS